MEISIRIISYTLILGLIVSPFIIYKKLNKKKIRYLFFRYLIIGLTITAFIFLTFAWWTDYSNELLLAEYGYTFETMDKAESFTNVAPDNLEKVKALRKSLMGIGWPLKAMMSYPIYTLYLLLVYLIGYGFDKFRSLKSD